MKRQLFSISVGVFALVSGVVIYAYSPFYWGKAQAQLDLMRGKYRYRVGPQTSAKFNEILAKEYDVEIVVIPVPVTGENLLDVRKCRPCQEAIGYDEVMSDALDKKHGHYVLQRVSELLEKESEKEGGVKAQE